MISKVYSDTPIITDVNSALDLMMNNEDRIIINKEAFCDEFFDLSTRLAGGVLQKFVTYGKKLAIVGDFSVYNSKALHDFIYECNNGNDVFWVQQSKKLWKCWKAI